MLNFWKYATEEEASKFKAHELLEEYRPPEAPKAPAVPMPTAMPRPVPTPRPGAPRLPAFALPAVPAPAPMPRPRLGAAPLPMPGEPRLPAFAQPTRPKQLAAQPETYGQALRQAVGQIPSLLSWGRQLVTPGQWPQGVPSFAQPITQTWEDFRQQVLRPASMITQERIAAPLLGELMRWNVPYRMLAPERAGPSPWAEIPGAVERAVGVGEPLPGLRRLPAFAKQRYEEARGYEATLPAGVRLIGRQLLDPLGLGGAWASTMLTGPLGMIYRIVDIADYTAFLLSATPDELKVAAALIGVGVTAKNLPKIRAFVKGVAGRATPAMRRAAQEAGPAVQRFMAEEAGVLRPEGLLRKFPGAEAVYESLQRKLAMAERMEDLTRDEWQILSQALAVERSQLSRRLGRAPDTAEIMSLSRQLSDIEATGKRAGWTPDRRMQRKLAQTELSRLQSAAQAKRMGLLGQRERYASGRWSNWIVDQERGLEGYRAQAEDIARLAQEENLPVPPEVLRDFPNLAEEAEAVEIPGRIPEAPPEEAAEIPPARIGLLGGTTRAMGPDPNKTYDFRYRVVELDELVTSHTDQLAENPAYLEGLQPRLRDRAASQAQITEIMTRPVFEELIEDTHTLDRGIMIVGPDMMVESGNARTIALRRLRAEAPEKYEAYKARMASAVGQYGIRAEAVEGLSCPVLVRERITRLPTFEARKGFTEEANRPSVLGMAPVENAIRDAERISDEAVAALMAAPEETVERALRRAANRDLVRGFLDSFSTTERATLVDRSGWLNAAGMQRLKGALFVKTYRGEAGQRLAEAFFESLDPGIKRIEHGLFSSLPEMAQVEALIRGGHRRAELSISEDLAKAVDVLRRLRQENYPVERYLSQMTMYERELSPFQEQLLQYLDGMSRSSRKVREFIIAYGEQVRGTAPPVQRALMAMPEPSKGELLDRAARTSEAAEAPQARLFAAPEVPEEAEAAPRPEARPGLERPEVAAKQPWQMTRAEARSFWETNADRLIAQQGQLAPFRAFGMTGPGSTARMRVAQDWFAREVQTGTDWAQIDVYHRGAVVKALEEGKLVPPEVLADYPDLAARAPAPEVPAARAGLEEVEARRVAPAAEAAREPWQMTREEFDAYGQSLQERQRRGLTPGRAGLTQVTPDAARASDELARIQYGVGHKRHIEEAARAGKPVPPEVLADYPDLAARYPRAPAPAPAMRSELESLLASHGTRENPSAVAWGGPCIASFKALTGMDYSEVNARRAWDSLVPAPEAPPVRAPVAPEVAEARVRRTPMERVRVTDEIARLRSEISRATDPMDRWFSEKMLEDALEAQRRGVEEFTRPVSRRPERGYQRAEVEGVEYDVPEAMRSEDALEAIRRGQVVEAPEVAPAVGPEVAPAVPPVRAPVTRPIPPPAEPAVPPAAVPAVPFRPAQPVPGAVGIPGQPAVPSTGAAVGVAPSAAPAGRPVQPPLAAAGVQIAPAGPPAGAVPPTGPPAAGQPPAPGPGVAMVPAVGPGRFAEMLPSSEILRLAQRPNNVRRLMDWAEQHPHSPLKWVLQRIGVSGTDPTSEATVLVNTIRADSDAAVMTAVARLRTLGDPDELFDVQDNVAHIAGQAVAIGDLAEGRVSESIKAALNSEQQAYLAEGWAYFDDLERLATAEGIDIPKATYGPGEHYWARNVMGRMMPDGTLEVATLRGAPSGRWLTALAGFERPREFDTMHEALANGFRYFSLSDAAEMSGRAIYRRIANKRVLDYIIDNIPSRVGKKARYGEVRLPGLKRYFQAEDIEGVKKLLEDSPLTWLEEFADVVNAVNRVPRTLTTTLDLGPMFAQLYTMLCNWPRQWAKAVGVGFQSAFEPVSFQRFLAQPDHAATVRRLAPYGLITSGSELTAGARRGLLTKIPLVDPAVKFGARIFDNMMTAARILGLEATDYQAKNADEVSELVAFWNKATGVVEPGAQGISRRQQKLEAAGLFAPRLYRATFGLLFDVGAGGLRGEMARNSLAQMAAVTLLGYVGLCRLLKQKPRLDPKEGSRWLTIQIGDQYVGIRGALFMTLRTLAQMARNPEDGRELAWRYVRGRLSPSLSTAMDVYNRADFIGMPIETPLQLTKRIVADNLTPFWIQGVFESGTKDWKELVAVGGAELAGLRTFPVSPARRRNEIRERLAQATFGIPWVQLNRTEIDQLMRVPELAEATEAAQALAVERRQPWALFWADVDSQREPYRIEIGELGQELQAGQRTGRSYREELTKRQMLMARIPEDLTRTRAYKEIRLEGREPENAVDRFIDDYYKIADEARDPLTGVASARQIVMDREVLKGRTPDDIVRQGMEHINWNLDPEYVQARNLYYEYMRIPQYLGLSEDEAQLANEAMRTYRAMRRANPQMHPDWTRAYLAKHNPEGYKLMLVAQQRRNPQRRRFWAEHPLLSKFYSDLTTEELETVLPEQSLWQPQPQAQLHPEGAFTLPAFAGAAAQTESGLRPYGR